MKAERNTLLAILVSAWIGAVPQAHACAFHGYVPDPTIVDILLGTEQAVIARPDPANPGQYVAIKALLGPDDVSVPLPVGAQMRAKLASGADVVLLARDEAYGPWLELAALDEEYRKVIDTVVARQQSWLLGGDKERYQLFADHLNAPNADLRRLALMELDRADYALLKALRLPRKAGLFEALESGDPELRPIRLLLAGLSGDRNHVPQLSAGLDRALKAKVGYLGAYATAWIELGGQDAVDAILNTHMMPAGLSVDTAEKLLEAFAIQNGTADRKTRKAIVEGVSALLVRNPQLAGAAARQFGFRGDWSLANAIDAARIARKPMDLKDVFAITQYIELARQ